MHVCSLHGNIFVAPICSRDLKDLIEYRSALKLKMEYRARVYFRQMPTMCITGSRG
jgi:hypothetical protein